MSEFSECEMLPHNCILGIIFFISASEIVGIGQVGLIRQIKSNEEGFSLDYVSDYQLKPACKDAICVVPSKVTQMIFAVLED